MKPFAAKWLMLLAMRLDPEVCAGEARRRHGTWYRATHTPGDDRKVL